MEEGSIGARPLRLQISQEGPAHLTRRGNSGDRGVGHALASPQRQLASDACTHTASVDLGPRERVLESEEHPAIHHGRSFHQAGHMGFRVDEVEQPHLGDREVRIAGLHRQLLPHVPRLVAHHQAPAKLRLRGGARHLRTDALAAVEAFFRNRLLDGDPGRGKDSPVPHLQGESLGKRNGAIGGHIAHGHGTQPTVSDGHAGGNFPGRDAVVPSAGKRRTRLRQQRRREGEEDRRGHTNFQSQPEARQSRALRVHGHAKP